MLCYVNTDLSSHASTVLCMQRRAVVELCRDHSAERGPTNSRALIVKKPFFLTILEIFLYLVRVCVYRNWTALHC